MSTTPVSQATTSPLLATIFTTLALIFLIFSIYVLYLVLTGLYKDYIRETRREAAALARLNRQIRFEEEGIDPLFDEYSPRLVPERAISPFSLLDGYGAKVYDWDGEQTVVGGVRETVLERRDSREGVEVPIISGTDDGFIARRRARRGEEE